MFRFYSSSVSFFGHRRAIPRSMVSREISSVKCREKGVHVRLAGPPARNQADGRHAILLRRPAVEGKFLLQRRDGLRWQDREDLIGLGIHIHRDHELGEDIFETIRIAKELSKKVVINTFYTSPREETGRSGYQDDADTELYIRAIKYLAELDEIKTIEINGEQLPPTGGPCHETTECGFLCGGGRSSFAIN